MEKNGFRILIKHYYLRGNMAKESEEKLDKYYGKIRKKLARLWRLFLYSDYMRRYWFYVKNPFRNFHQTFTF